MQKPSWIFTVPQGSRLLYENPVLSQRDLSGDAEGGSQRRHLTSEEHNLGTLTNICEGTLEGNGSLKSNQTLFLQKRQRRFKRLELLPLKLTSRRDDRLKPALGDQMREPVGPCTVIRDPHLATSHIMPGLHNIDAVIGHIFAHAKRPIPFGLGEVLHHKATKKHAGRTSTVLLRKLSTEE